MTRELWVLVSSSDSGGGRRQPLCRRSATLSVLGVQSSGRRGHRGGIRRPLVAFEDLDGRVKYRSHPWPQQHEEAAAARTEVEAARAEAAMEAPRPRPRPHSGTLCWICANPVRVTLDLRTDDTRCSNPLGAVAVAAPAPTPAATYHGWMDR